METSAIVDFCDVDTGWQKSAKPLRKFTALPGRLREA
jgi:hypothetical protein